MTDELKPRRLRTNDLTWFDVKKYSDLERRTLSDWSGDLMLRYMLRGMLEPREDDQAIHILGQVLTTPVKLKRRQGSLLAKGLPCVWNRRVSDVYFDYGVLCGDAMREILEQCQAWSKQAEEADDKDFPPLPRIMDRAWDDVLTEKHGDQWMREQVIYVNLHASDQQLLEDFKDWLALKRITKNMNVPRKHITDQDLHEWSRYRVLAFIDLDLFCCATRSSISNATIGAMLFPDEYDVDLGERIRKVVRPMATRLMNDSFLSTLDEQVSRAERKKP